MERLESQTGINAAVSSNQRITERLGVIELECANIDASFDAGQAALIRVNDDDPGSLYSIASTPAEYVRERRLKFLVRWPDGARPSRLATVREGDLLRLTVPVGNFHCAATPRGSLLFLAGGTGIAPVRSIVRHLVSNGYRWSITVVHTARTARDFAFMSEWLELARCNVRFVPVVTDLKEVWSGVKGRLFAHDLAILLSSVDAAGYFVSGPPAFVAHYRKQLAILGIAPELVHVGTD